MTAAEILNLNGPILALFGVIVTVITNYVIGKKRDQTAEYTIDRTILSQDQKEFKDSIMEELNICRANVKSLQEENERLHSIAMDSKSDKVKLSIEIVHLQSEIVTLKKLINSIAKDIDI